MGVEADCGAVWSRGKCQRAPDGKEADATFPVSSTCASSLYTLTYDQLVPEFHSSREVATLGLSLFVAGLGLGPMILSPLSEVGTQRHPPKSSVKAQSLHVSNLLMTSTVLRSTMGIHILLPHVCHLVDPL